MARELEVRPPATTAAARPPSLSPSSTANSDSNSNSNSNSNSDSDSDSAELEQVFASGRERILAYSKFGPCIGTGSEGVVRMAVSLETGKRVAIKATRRRVPLLSFEIQSPMGTDNSLAQQLLQSSRQLRRKFDMLSSLPRHPNLLEIIEHFETRDAVYLVTELCDVDLRTLMLRCGGKFDENAVRVMVHGILRGLSFLHQNGIVHRDLKPQNIFLRSLHDLSSICIADFSAASVPDSEPGLSQVLGTPFYMAPCVVRGHHNYSSKIDLWAAGCVAFELVFGKSPFSAATAFFELYSLIATGSWGFPADAEGIGSVQFREFVGRLLVVDPSTRLSADEAARHPWFADAWGEERLRLLLAGL